MTQQEKQEIIAAVLDALQTNSKSIAQLTSVTELQDSDLIEVAGGRRVSYGTIKSLMGALFDGSIDEKLGENNELYFSESGRLRSSNATCVVLKSMGSALDNAFNDSQAEWSYNPSVGDTYYDATTKKIVYYEAVGSLISSDPDGGLVYCNAHTNATYRWKGTEWEQVGGMGSDITIINDLTTGGGDKALSAEMGKRLKSNINAVQANIQKLYNKLANMAFWDAGDQAAAEPTPLDWSVPKHKVTLSLSLSNAVVKDGLGNTLSNGAEIQVEEGGTLTLTVEPASGYALTSVTSSTTGADVTDLGNGTYSVAITMGGSNIALSISATAAQAYSVTLNLTGCQMTSGQTSIQSGGTFVFTANTDLLFPIALGGDAVSGATIASYTVSGTTATLVIEDANDDVTIAITAKPLYDFHIGMFVDVSKYYIQNKGNLSRACILSYRDYVQNSCTWNTTGVSSNNYRPQDLLDYSTIPIPSGATKVSLQCDATYWYGLGLVDAYGAVQNNDFDWIEGSTKKEYNFADYPNATHILVNFKIGSTGTAYFSNDDTLASMGVVFSIE